MGNYESYRTRRVDGHEFVRGFVQHTLPSGFQKIRYYGWMSANSQVSLDEVQWLVWLFLGWTYGLGRGHAPQLEPRPQPQVRCSHCGAIMHVVAVTNSAAPRVFTEFTLPYLDSG